MCRKNEFRNATVKAIGASWLRGGGAKFDHGNLIYEGLELKRGERFSLFSTFIKKILEGDVPLKLRL